MPGALPTVVTRQGRSIPKPKLSFAARVSNNSQKKIETLTRIDDVMLKSMYRFYDLERVICENGFQKDSQNLHKQIHTYQKSLFDSKSLRKRGETQTFMTEPGASLDQIRTPTALKSAGEKKIRPTYGKYVNCEPEAIGSVRRKTQNLQSNSVNKSLSDLHRLREKHALEYRESLEELQKLQRRMELTLSLHVPKRSYTPFTEPLLYSPIIVSLRNKIKHSEKELIKLQKRLQQQSRKYEKPLTAADGEQEDDEEPENEMTKTVHIFCEKKLDEREKTILSPRPNTTHLPQLGSRRNSRAVKLDLEKLKSDPACSHSMLSLLAQNSKNSYIEIIDNPFDTGVIPPQTRSRLLIEAKRDNKMYQWLGFKTAAQLEAALKENPQSIKQIPAALLSMVEEEEDEETNLDNEQFSESDSGGDDDEDIRFKIFDKRKFKKDKRRVSIKTAQI